MGSTTASIMSPYTKQEENKKGAVSIFVTLYCNYEENKETAWKWTTKLMIKI